MRPYIRWIPDRRNAGFLLPVLKTPTAFGLRSGSSLAALEVLEASTCGQRFHNIARWLRRGNRQICCMAHAHTELDRGKLGEDKVNESGFCVLPSERAL